MKTIDLTLYHNSECSKCRAVLQILEESKVPFTLVEYLSSPPSEAVLDRLLTELNLAPEQIVRKGEDEFQALKLDTRPPQSREAWIKVLVANPILIERPIVSNGLSAVVGRPPERVRDWLRDFIN